MTRVEPEALENHELARVYLAGTLAEAQQVEGLLTGTGVDYVVKVEPFRTSLFFGVRNGAAFYVADGQADYCRSHLAAAGMAYGVQAD